MQMNARAERLALSEMERFSTNLPQGTIPFTSGAPGPDAMPLGLLREKMDQILSHEPGAFGYGDQAGSAELRDVLAGYACKLGFGAPLDRHSIVLTNGGMGGASLVSSLLLEPGDVVACENPSYPEVMECFRKEGVTLLPLPMDSRGMHPQALREAAKKHRIKLVYIIPHFQNPSGARLSMERRLELAQVARDEDLTIFEDDPYRELWFDRPADPAVAALAPERTIFCGSFSKTFAPGLRSGWLMGPKEFIDKAEALQGFTSLGTPWFISRAIARLWDDPRFSDHLQALRGDLASRRDAVVQTLQGLDHVEFTPPEGGMFVWLNLKNRSGDDTVARLRQEGIATLPGRLFSPDGTGCNHCIRLTYARQNWSDLREGLIRLRRGLEALA